MMNEVYRVGSIVLPRTDVVFTILYDNEKCFSNGSAWRKVVMNTTMLVLESKPRRKVVKVLVSDGRIGWCEKSSLKPMNNYLTNCEEA